MINKQMIHRSLAGGHGKKKKSKLSKREKAHAYAANIKKPTTPNVSNAADDQYIFTQDENYGGRELTMADVEGISPLDHMELEHEKNRFDVENIRRRYGI